MDTVQLVESLGTKVARDKLEQLQEKSHVRIRTGNLVQTTWM